MGKKGLVVVLEGFYTILFSSVIIAQTESISSREVAVTAQQDKINGAFNEYTSMKSQIYKNLSDEFSSDLKRWNATINKDDLSVQFFMNEKSPKVMFDGGSPTQTEYYNDMIRDFCPRYYSVVRPFLDSTLVTEIKIEGHTSSEWMSNSSDDESYYKNLELSQGRAKNVMESCLRSIESSYGKDYVVFRKKTTASGVASSKPVLRDDGTENTSASRRVEFKIVTSFDDNLEKLK
jgi:flagellar motor protein MotB